MDDIHRILAALRNTAQKSALATILRVEGSAYRKSGASMLFLENGTQIGLLSAGCLEADLQARAERMFANGEVAAHTLVYDMRQEDDLGWGKGAGCNGAIHVRLERVTPGLRNHLGLVKQYLDLRVPVLHFRKWESDEYLFLPENGEPFGNWDGSLPDDASDLYTHRHLPKPRLLLFGGGPDVLPLAACAKQAGFAVEITNEVRVLAPDDFAVIMTHSFQQDRALLQSLLKQDLRYLGILGPRRRTERLLDGESIPARLHSPVGLSIGAEGTDEIAVSIVADLIRTYRSRS